MKRIVVGTDGSGPAGRSVAWAANVAGALHADLVVATAVGPKARDAHLEGVGPSRERIGELIDGPWSAPARSAAVRLSTAVLDGDPRAALLDAVVAQRADALVVGSMGVGWFPAPHLGHVAHALAHHCPVPMVIVPPGAATERPSRILVGIDGSSGSAAAVEWAGALAAALHAEVVAVHAHMRAGPNEPGSDYTKLEASCEEWAAPLREAGLTRRIVIAQGWPASAIAELETVEAPCLVVLGARGAGGFNDLRLGSVVLGVLQRSVAPVAVVPGEDQSGAASAT